MSDRELLDVDGVVLGEDRPQWAGDVGRGELGRGDLVQEGLELVVVVAVEQRDVDVVLGELLGAPDPGEPAADDDDRRHRLVMTHG